jgi:hypothetical protein
LAVGLGETHIGLRFRLGETPVDPVFNRIDPCVQFFSRQLAHVHGVGV